MVVNIKMKNSITIQGKMIYVVQSLFYLYFIAYDFLQQNTGIEANHVIGKYCIASFIICTIATFYRKTTVNFQKYLIATSLLILAVIYGIIRGDIALIQGTFLAIVCLNSLHMDTKLNLFEGVIITVIYGVMILFFPSFTFAPLVNPKDIIIKLVTLYAGQIMLIVLIYMVYTQNHVIQYKSKNAKTMLKIVEGKRKEATHANKAKSDFLANMSHEIRTPMNAIIGMSEMILRMEISDEVRENAVYIKNAGKSLLTIINDILDFSKIEAGKMEIIPAKYQISSVLNDIINMSTVRIGKKPIEFIVEADENLPYEMFGDEIRIKQILINYINNAIKFTKNGTVTLRVNGVRKADKITLVMSVEDTGIGIKQEDLNKLFVSFSQVDTKRNRSVEGTGLGLAICKNLTELMGGRVEVKSEYGNGSIFSAMIPQKVIDPTPIGNFRLFKSEEEGRGFDVHFTASKAKLLIVDDNSVNLVVARGLLKPYGTTIVTATSAKDCLKILEMGTFDMIFMDHMMPVMDGVEAAGIIRKKDKKIPIIALTANAISGVREMYLENGFNDYLSKPIDVKAMHKILLHYLPKDYIKQKKSSVQFSALPVLNEEILRSIYLEGQRKIPLLKKLYGEKDWKNYAIETHALKSVAAIAGQTTLSEMAKAHEMAAKTSDMRFIKENFDTFLHIYEEYVSGLSYVAEDKSNGQEKTVLEQNVIEDLLEKIKRGANEFDIDSINEAIAVLKTAQLSEKQSKCLKHLAEAADLLDYETLLNLL